MKRRRFVQTALALPAGSVALLGQSPALAPKETNSAPPGPPGGPLGDMQYPVIKTVGSDEAGVAMPRFFSAGQMAALTRVSDLLMPRTAEGPGAAEAKVAEFLDFWVGKSPEAVQKVYTAGLDALNKQAGAQYKKPFAELDDTQAAAVIAPGIQVQWSLAPPKDPLAHFLQDARRDIRMATMNSREYAAAMGASSGGGGRRQGGMGRYWNSLD